MTIRRCLLVLALLAAPAAGWAFPIDVDFRSEGLDVDIVPMRLDYGAVVKVQNNESLPVKCDARFKNGPEEKRRSATIPPGEVAPMRYSAQRQILRLKVVINCVPVPE
jgi:hypothetical protein